MSLPKSLDILYGGTELLAKYVSELTDGKFQIQPFASGELVGAGQIADAVANQTIEMGHSASQYYYGKDPTFTLGNGIPFGLNARQMNAWLYEGGNDLLNTFYAKHKMHALPGGNTGGQMGGWYRKEIKSLEDFQGLRLRIGGLAGSILAKLGVVPIQLPGSDVYVALERGAIDAAEFTGPYDDQKLGFVKVAPYYYYPGFWEGCAAVHFFFNLDLWNDLPPAYKSALTAAAAAANMDVLCKYDAQNPDALRALLGAGAQLRPFSQDILDAAWTASHETYDELSSQNENWKTIYSNMIEFRNKSYAWWQVDEYSYDSYMIRARARK
ncbi:MAG: TRAP transporter substrate-binding protein DctP [Rhodospirillum sp.]|nr:TRAP transporter substrate-binding protein DctP [Rhodospirillum sp.]MCF8491779.1 TRAP transporter substrate-binding protein DctP [Rhodospirillum sp.]MCF8501418.1 TRAP transporter substrate-binding protein DctP [Rhodospirillum sp.]